MADNQFISIKNSKFIDNKASISAGAFYFMNIIFEISDTDFEKNNGIFMAGAGYISGLNEGRL